MKVGIIGSGNIGSALGPLWAAKRHSVMYASRHPQQLAMLASATGHGARAATPAEAAKFAEVILLAVPYHATPELGRQLGAALAGKVVLDAGNPNPERDGEIATQCLASGRGTGVATAASFPRARVVRAFNTVWSETLKREAHRAGARVGIPLAGNDHDALEIAATLVRDAGFDPVFVGALSEARRFDPGTSVFNTGMSGAELRQALKMP